MTTRLRMAMTLLLALAHCGKVSSARAVEQSSSDPQVQTSEASPDGATAEERSMGYWGDQKARGFAAGDLAAGVVSGASVTAGYGKPHFVFLGVRAEGLLTTDFLASTVGLQANALLLNVHARIRRTIAHSHRFPEVLDSYDASDLAEANAPRARYTSFDLVLSGVIPLGPILGYWRGYGIWMFDVPADRAVLAEMVRYTTHDPRAFMVYASLWWRLLGDAVLLGPGADVSFSSGRKALIRVGPSAIWSLGPHLSLEAILTLPVSSPDPGYGLLDQAWGNLGVRWKWATGEPAFGLF